MAPRQADADAVTDRLNEPGVVTSLPPGVPPPPAPPAAGWLVADLTTSQVLAASNAHGRYAPASTLKALTALALVPRLAPGDRYTATDADAAIDGSKVGLVPGSVYTVDDLVHGLMLGSGNDTANALAALSGGMGPATSRMTTLATRLGARDTTVVNTSGLDAPGQVSSAHDLAVFGRELLKDRELATIVATTRYRFPAAGTDVGPKRTRFEIQNHDRLLRNYPGATGVKNGYTVAAQGSFIGSATRGGHSYLVTLINSPGSTWIQVRALLDWAFAYGDAARPVGLLASGPLATGPLTSPLATGPLATGALAGPSAATTSASGAAGESTTASGAPEGRVARATAAMARSPLTAGLVVVAALTLAAVGTMTIRVRHRSVPAHGRRPR